MTDERSHLKARVRALPGKDVANTALEELVAKVLGVPASTVAVSTGSTARLKTLRITGDLAVLTKAVEALAGR